MSEDSKTVVSCRLPMCSTLFIVFLILKLTGTINWSWWAVTVPLWLPFALWVLTTAVICVVVFLLKLCTRGY